jgi:Asp-tRNA(Asn)/Glu-tRNA(Gln) amidotransferase B subunit
LLLKLRSFKAINRAFKEVRDEGNFADLETVEIERSFTENLGHKIQAIMDDRRRRYEAKLDLQRLITESLTKKALS